MATHPHVMEMISFCSRLLQLGTQVH